MSEAPALDPRALSEKQQARVDRALQAGWIIRHDPERFEYRASRELYTARTLDGLLDAIGVPDD